MQRWVNGIMAHSNPSIQQSGHLETLLWRFYENRLRSHQKGKHCHRLRKAEGPAMTEQEMRDEIRRLAPFRHAVDLPYGLSTYVPELNRRETERTRLSNLVKHVWPSLLQICGGSFHGQRILDVGCNCGGFSFGAAKSGAEYVLGIDVVDRYVEQANFIKRALALQQVEFKKMLIEDLDEAIVGHFDITFCFGILYNLENPVLAMKKLSSVTRRIMVVDTDVAQTAIGESPIWRMNFRDPDTPESPSISTSLWRMKRVCQFEPNAHAVNELLNFIGFSNVMPIEPVVEGLEKRYYRGKRKTWLARRE